MNTQPEHDPIIDSTIDIDGIKYVPISRNLLTIKSGQFKSKLTADQYQEAVDAINVIIDKLGGPLVTTHYTYADKLYPRQVLTILALSRSEHWPPGIKIDEILEVMLTQWLADNISDYQQFSRQLFIAANDLNCLEGIYLRLNHDIVGQDTSTITITTKFGTIHQNTYNQLLTNQQSKEIKGFLQRQDQFLSRIDDLYSRLRTIHQSYNLEQALLGWMGYLIVRAIVRGNSTNLRLHGKELLAIGSK